MTVHPETDHPGRFSPGSRMRAGDRTLVVAARRSHRGRLLVKFEGIEDRTQAESLRGCRLTISIDERRPLGPEEYWPDQLVGLEVRAVGAGVVGRVVDVVEGAAQDRLVVEKPGGRRVEVPFVRALVPRVDLQERFVEVVPLEGMF